MKHPDQDLGLVKDGSKGIKYLPAPVRGDGGYGQVALLVYHHPLDLTKSTCS